MTALMSCYDTATVVCDNDGLRCPVGKVCVLEGTLCVDPGQEDEAELCRGRNESDECGDPLNPGHCKDGICVDDLCGNNVVESWEACDDGNKVPGDGCSADCSLTCGDKTIDEGELCDPSVLATSCLALGFDLGTAPCADDCQDYDETECINLGWMKSEAIPEDWHLLGVWAFAKNNVFAVGMDLDIDSATLLAPEETVDLTVLRCLTQQCGIVVHYDGATWTRVEEGPIGPIILTSIWASAPDDIYVVGFFGEVWHFDGEGWYDISLEDKDVHLTAVWGGEGSLIAVGGSAALGSTETHPVIVRRHDEIWGRMELPLDVQQSNSYLWSVWGDGLGGWFVGGKFGQSLRYDDDIHSWRTIDDSAIANMSTFSISGDSAGNVLYTGEAGEVVHYDGSEWKRTPSGTDVELMGTWADEDGPWFAVGGVGTILRRAGAESAWEKEQTDSTAHLMAVHGSPDGHVVAVGLDGTILSRRPRWHPMPTPVEAGGIIALRGIPGRCLYAAAHNEHVFEHDLNANDEWRDRLGPNQLSFRDLLVTDCTDVTVLTSRRIYALEDTNLIPHSYPSNKVFSSIWGGDDGGFVVGDDGLILRQAGPRSREWLTATAPAVTEDIDLIKVWGSDLRNVFAIGDNGSIFRFDGSEWTLDMDASPFALQDVAGDHDGNVYVLSDQGYVFKRDSQNNWETILVDYNTLNGLRTILPVGAGKLFVAGRDGFLSFYDGEHWTPIKTPTTAAILSLWSNGFPGDLYIGTADSAIYRLDVSAIPELTATSQAQ
ncbi:hypothetical protein [Haliangium sp.]|uniref:hypothetical protein n=2 Tax=Haliangium sp. TaxID=2663208 RepID=UPI003D0E5C60